MSGNAAAAIALRSEGLDPKDIADRFGVNLATVYRWLKAGPSSTATADALEDLLSGLDLDALGRANAAIARVLAAKLDEAKGSETAAVAMAVPSIAKELRNVVEAIMEVTGDDKEWVAGLFS